MKRLQINGNDILVYYVINGFTNTKGVYKGGRAYLADFINSNTKTIDRILKRFKGKRPDEMGEIDE